MGNKVVWIHLVVFGQDRKPRIAPVGMKSAVNTSLAIHIERVFDENEGGEYDVVEEVL